MDRQPTPRPPGVQSRRRLTNRLGLAPDAFPAGGAWYPDDAVLEALLDLIETRAPAETVLLGGGSAVLVAALASRGGVTAVDHDTQALRVTREMLEGVGATRARVLEAELQDHSKHEMWYARTVLDHLPPRIDLLFIDGPGHFAGRAPRYPAGPELFARLGPGAAVLLDDGQRVKEGKALRMWARDFPHLVQTKLRGGAVLLTRKEGI